MAETDWLQIHSGIKFHFLSPSTDEIFIEDIAHSLSNLCRYNGHCKFFYPVAYHAVLVSKAISAFYPDGECTPRVQLMALLHDAAEAYVGDMTWPLKRQSWMGAYRHTEDSVQEKVWDRFGLWPSETEQHVINTADLAVLRCEAEQILTHPPIDGWTDDLPDTFKEPILRLQPREAKHLFLTRFRELTGIG